MRKSGVLLHISSLPSDYGIGSLGVAARAFADYLNKSGFKLWQTLPLGPTSYGDSPYQSPSAFAGNPYFIDLDMLFVDELVTAEELKDLRVDWERVNYEELYKTRFEVLKKAYARFSENIPLDYYAFEGKHSFWLGDYAEFMTVKEAHGMVALERWGKEYRDRNGAAVKELVRNNPETVGFYKFIQYEFFRQWHAFREYVNGKGIKLIGDMPIYVALDSADVWAHPENFVLDADGNPTAVAGVPPDMFSATGQLWGNPLYDWDKMASDGYKWWISRINAAAELFDAVRIDHFRGFSSYYSIDCPAVDARVGEWKKGPAEKLFDEVKAMTEVEIIAEDLGLITDDVRELVRYTGYPTMKVAQFGFDNGVNSEHYPRNYPENCTAYTGTHDNDTTKGWYKSLTANEKKTVRSILGCTGGNVTAALTEKVMTSAAKYAIIPMQDVLNLDGDARMNVPSTLGGNWEFRLHEIPKVSNKIKKLIALSKR